MRAEQGDALDPGEHAVIEEFARRFESAWQDGAPPSLERAFSESQIPRHLRSVLMEELLALDVEYRRRMGETPQESDYRARFSNYGEVVAKVFRDAAPSSAIVETQSVSGESPPSTSNERRQSPEQRVSAESLVRDKECLPKQLGRYRILKQIGEGGFGRVFLARDEDLDRLVAIKASRQDLFRSGEDAKRFLREARTAAKLRHPGIVTVFDVIRAPDNSILIVMEYVDGGPLTVESGPAYAPLDAAELIAQVADTMHFAHTQGYVHRDLKPSNILLDSSGRPFVADPGLAIHESEQIERAGEVSGTLAYMSPEQARGLVHHLDGRADVWSLGVILYEMLTGRRPFVGKTRDELVDEILNRPPKPPRQINDSIPADLERICLKAINKDVADRYSTAHDLAEDIRRVASELAATPVPSQRQLGESGGQSAQVSLTPSREGGSSAGNKGLRLGPFRVSFIVALLVLPGCAIVVTMLIQSIFFGGNPASTERPKPSPGPQIWTRFAPEGKLPRVHNAPIRMVAVAETPDVRYAASCDEDGVIVLWNLDTQEFISVQDAPQPKRRVVCDLCFSKDGQWLAAFRADEGGGSVSVWSVSNFNPVLDDSITSPQAVKLIAGDGPRVIWALCQAEDHVELCDVLTGKTDYGLGVASDVEQVIASYDSNHLALAHFVPHEDRWNARLWNLRNKDDLKHTSIVLNPRVAVCSLALGKDGYIAVGGYNSDGGIQLLKGSESRPLSISGQDSLHYHHVAFSENGELLFDVSWHVADSGEDSAVLRAWSVETGKCVAKESTEMPVGVVAYLPRSNRVLLASGRSLFEWKLPE